MARPKKNNTPLSIRLDTQLFNRLNNYCERSGQTKTTAVERALEMFIDDYDRRMTNGISQGVPEDIMKIIIQGAYEARKKVEQEEKDYQETHEKLVTAMQDALGIDKARLEELKTAGDFEGIQKMIDEAMANKI